MLRQPRLCALQGVNPLAYDDDALSNLEQATAALADGRLTGTSAPLQQVCLVQHQSRMHLL